MTTLPPPVGEVDPASTDRSTPLKRKVSEVVTSLTVSPRTPGLIQNPYQKAVTPPLSSTPKLVNNPYAKKKPSVPITEAPTTTGDVSGTESLSILATSSEEVFVCTTLKNRFETLCEFETYLVQEGCTLEVEANFKPSTFGRFLQKYQQSPDPNLICFLAMDKTSDVIQPVFGLTTLDGTKMVGILELDDDLDIQTFTSSCTTTCSTYCRTTDDVQRAVEKDEMRLMLFFGDSMRSLSIRQYFPVPLKIALLFGLKPMSALQFMKDYAGLLDAFNNARFQIWLQCAATCCRGQQCSILGVDTIGLKPSKDSYTDFTTMYFTYF